MTGEHLPIGEVLNLLQSDFPDITISKIRFLESQGLISPERTPSGYRKFYGPDIDRLRWILLQQRENFLPLKVIKERLEAEGADMGAPVATDVDDPAPAEEAEEPAPTEPEPVANSTSVRSSMPAGELESPHLGGQEPIWMADLAASRSQRTVRKAAALPLDGHTEADEVRLGVDELLDAAGITADDLADLERYGLLHGRTLGGVAYYDADALVIAKRAAMFFTHGVEARHLRMFKVAAEREAGFLEQLVLPMLKRRNPTARSEAVVLLEELSDLGHDLRAALLRSNLREHLERS